MPFNLDDYVPVAERLVAFYGEYPKGSIQTDIIELSDKRVVMRATVYRDPTDERPSIAHSALSIPGTTQFTRGSEIENAETSAIGRAIAMLGFEVKRGVASREEVRNKQDEEPKPKPKPDEASAARLAGHDPGGIVGVIEESKAWAPHYAPKIDPVHGFIVEFKLKGDGRGGGIKVQAHGLLAEQLSDIGDALTGQRVTAWGPIRDETFRPSGAKRDVTYQVLQLERMAGPFGTLPKVSPLRDPEQEVVDAIPVAEGQEALFDAAESARIDAEEASKA